MDDQTLAELLRAVPGDEPPPEFVLGLRDQLDDILDEFYADRPPSPGQPAQLIEADPPTPAIDLTDVEHPGARSIFAGVLAAAVLVVIAGIGLVLVLSDRTDDQVVVTTSELASQLVSRSQQADVSADTRLVLLAEATALQPTAENFALLGTELQRQGHLELGSVMVPGVHDVSISPNGRYVLAAEGFGVGGFEFDFMIWDVQADTLDPLELPLATARTTRFLPTGELVAVAQDQTDRQAYRLDDLREVSVPPVDTVSADGRVGALVYSSDTVLFDVASGDETARSQVFEPDTYRLNHDGSIMIASQPRGVSAPARIVVWETDDPSGFTDAHPLGTIGAASALLVDFSSDGRLVVVGTEERVDVYDAATLEPRSSFVVGGDLRRIDLSADSRTLLTAHGTDPSIARMWDVASGQMLLADIELPPLTRTDRSSATNLDTVEFSADAGRLVVADPDTGRVGVWELDRDEWIDLACEARPDALDVPELDDIERRACP